MLGSTTLRSLLGPLEPLLASSAVRELIVSAPDRVTIAKQSGTERITQTISESRIRAIADRLVRLIGPPFERDRWRGGIGFGLGARVFGAPHGSRVPIVHIYRLSIPNLTLGELIAGSEAGTLAMLEEACADGCSIVVAGRRASGKTAMLGALGRLWKQKKKVALIEANGALEAADVGHVRLDADLEGRATRDAIELGADVIVADDAAPRTLAALFELGRPFIASLEASDGSNALARLVARAWPNTPGASREAAEMFVESSVDLIVEMSREDGQSHVRLLELAREKGALIVRPALSRTGLPAAISGDALLATPSAIAIPAEKPKEESDHQQPAPPPPRVASAARERPTSRAPRRATPLASSRLTPREKSTPRELDLTPSLGIALPSVLGAKDLGSLVAIPVELPAVPIEAGGLHGFEHAEVSEIRAEQLVSKSFVMSLSDLAGHDDAPGVIAVDLPAEHEDQAGEHEPEHELGKDGGNEPDHHDDAHEHQHDQAHAHEPELEDQASLEAHLPHELDRDEPADKTYDGVSNEDLLDISHFALDSQTMHEPGGALGFEAHTPNELPGLTESASDEEIDVDRIAAVHLGEEDGALGVGRVEPGADLDPSEEMRTSSALEAEDLADDDDSLVSPIADVELSTNSVRAALGDSDVEDDELAAVVSFARDPSERPRIARTMPNAIPEDLDDDFDPDDSRIVTKTEVPQDLEEALDARQVRRDAQERTPTVLNAQSGADNPLFKDAPPVSTSNRDSWAQAEYARHASDDDEPASIESLIGAQDLITSSGPAPSGELDARELLTGSAIPSYAGEPPLHASDMDSTQSAQLGEMVSGFDLARSDPSDPAESDFSNYATMHPDADDPAEQTSAGEISSMPLHRDELLAAVGKLHIPQEPTRDLPRMNGAKSTREEPREFDEVTPYSPLLDRDQQNARARGLSDPSILAGADPLHQRLDPNRAAMVSGEEFDAMLDEIRDVTNASMFDNESTESAGHARPAPAKPAPAGPPAASPNASPSAPPVSGRGAPAPASAPDGKKRPRLR